MSIFKLPDLGEGLPEAEIVEWHVNVGDIVKVDQPLVSMETAKAVVEVPSPHEGKITNLYGNTGDTILTGSPLVEFSVSKNINDTGTHGDKAIESERKDTGTVAGQIEETDEILEEQKVPLLRTGSSISAQRATPAVRALAKKLNVDLADIIATGSNNTITSKDLQNALRNSESNLVVNSRDLSGYEPLKGVRKAMAHAMIKSHKEVVPVTVCDDAELINWKGDEDITIRIIQAIVAGCKAEPALNAFFDGETLSRKLCNEINLGIAMDTEDGLFVPVIKDIASKSEKELRDELNQLKIEVKNRSIPKDKLHGATSTLSNFGKFAGRYANPIVVVPPQVAIIGTGVIREEPVVVNGEIKVSKVLPISISFDHRAVTGGEATRFISTLISVLE